MLAALSTLLIAVGTLAILGCNVLATGFFLRTPPRGEQAMGLVVFIFAFVIASAMVLLGSLLVSVRSERAISSAVHLPALISGGATLVISFGVLLAAFVAFTAWAEPTLGGTALRAVKPVFCWTFGIMAPALLAVVLIIDAWCTPAGIEAPSGLLGVLRGLCWALAAMAVLGYLGAGVAYGPPMKQAISKHVASVAAERRRTALPPGMTLEMALRQDLDQLPPTAPLTDYLRFFTMPVLTKNTACRELLTQRMLATAGADDQLLAAMSSDELRSRWGGAEFIRTAPDALLKEHQAAWAAAMRAAILKTCDDIDIRPGFLTDNYELNPNPSEFFQSILRASERFRGTADHAPIDEALKQLAKNADSLNRSKRWDKVSKVMSRAGYPIPNLRGLQ